MIQSIPTYAQNDTIGAIVDAVKETGVVLIPEFVDVSTVEDLRSLTHKLLPKKDSYAFGRSVRLMKDQCNKHPLISQLFLSRWAHKLCRQYFGGSTNVNVCQEAFLHIEDTQTDEWARNGFLHFDRLHAFKLFLYLTDTDVSNGAFHFIPGTRALGEELRKKAWKQTSNYDSVKNRPDIDYKHLGYTDTQATPVEAQAGTLILLDTDVFHFGGRVMQSDRPRMVARSHNRKK